ncbi:hypothetical protein LEP1GSC116_1526 [Leptospira interrogans serovar Icterohaemorrhagiae str. Verdun HP]|uniref:Uncharacterized protein n=3 Tax=Leptospira interrogans TaxID=173 RepID=M6RXX7_LEPIR|nr:hypothetical protein LEP1GSC027_3868 [Leptospira interrogans str. 2002000624]EKQ40311.1 hypothetical protein LEP1GSC025_2339 [Leptospira interrogans str. 2002000621]EKQ49886.1 hypothetical protein LEP1GSC026_1302 [Leptospira interrogans str. 2002000623]EKR44816.1 hypothetical protein LEP1GSC097_3771 [Leptospira interrogans serovar Grippotyphosa str. UI 08368]EMG20534.1 hypothetical protein LEP1GSC150_5381 [Leptospira interrogans serovar Copenhageni str. LT2050]EMM82580.1 hypothetical protei
MFRKRILSLSSCNLLIQTSYFKETFSIKHFPFLSGSSFH